MFKPNDRVILRATGTHHTVRVGGVSELIELDNGERYPEDALKMVICPVPLSRPKQRVKASGSFPSYAALRKMEHALANLPVTEVNGHWDSGRKMPHKSLDTLWLSQGNVTPALYEVLFEAPGTGTWGTWVPFDLAGQSSCHLDYCAYCGGPVKHFETDGRAVRVRGEPCEASLGQTVSEVELNVPSGYLVYQAPAGFFPVLRRHFGETREQHREAQRAYASVGLLVGWRVPSVELRKVSEELYRIVQPAQDEEWDPGVKEYTSVKTARPLGRKLCCLNDHDGREGFALCDLDEYRRRRDYFIEQGLVDPAQVPKTRPIRVRPGVYRLRHDYHAKLRAQNNTEAKLPAEVLHATLEWVREPDPEQDLFAPYRDAQANAHAYVQQQLAEWPTLFGAGGAEETAELYDRWDRGEGSADHGLSREELQQRWAAYSDDQRRMCWQKVADGIFCGITGTVWHERGFPVAPLNPEVVDIEPPSFRQRYRWYLASKGYGGLWYQARVLSTQAPSEIQLAPPFAKLAFRVMESILSFGVATKYPLSQVQEHVRMLRERYLTLAARYPEQADPEYVQWLGHSDRFDRWVSNLEATPEDVE